MAFTWAFTILTTIFVTVTRLTLIIWLFVFLVIFPAGVGVHVFRTPVARFTCVISVSATPLYAFHPVGITEVSVFTAFDTIFAWSIIIPPRITQDTFA